jgi:hypothetical protein
MLVARAENVGAPMLLSTSSPPPPREEDLEVIPPVSELASPHNARPVYAVVIHVPDDAPPPSTTGAHDPIFFISYLQFLSCVIIAIVFMPQHVQVGWLLGIQMEFWKRFKFPWGRSLVRDMVYKAPDTRGPVVDGIAKLILVYIQG